MKIVIAGGNGFVGNALTDELVKNHQEVFILTRHASSAPQKKGVKYVQWLNNGDQPEKQLKNIDVFINLAGESLNSGRWTADRKKRLLASRLASTKEMVRIITSADKKPQLFLNASAIGYYGTSRTETFTERNIKYPSDFLSNVTNEWEKAAKELENIRTIYMRFGVIIGKDGGALQRMVLPYKLYVGGTIGSGEQILSWIHMKDCIQAILFCINNESIEGAVNFTAPEPLNMKEFGKTIGKVMKKPHWLPVPSFALKILLGEMSILVLEGQRVLPKKLCDHGFKFTFPTLETALRDIFI